MDSTANSDDDQVELWHPEGSICFSLKVVTGGFILNVQNCVTPRLHHPYLKVITQPGSHKAKIELAEIHPCEMNRQYNVLLFKPVLLNSKRLKKMEIVLKDRVLFGNNRSISKYQTVIREISDYTHPQSFRLMPATATLNDFMVLYRGGIRVAVQLKKSKCLEVVVQSCFNLPRFVRCPYISCYLMPYERTNMNKQTSPISRSPSPRTPDFGHLFSFETLPKDFDKMASVSIEVLQSNVEQYIKNGQRDVGKTVIGAMSSDKSRRLWQRVLKNPDRFHYESLTLTN